jgi:hypothetical protein
MESSLWAIRVHYIIVTVICTPLRSVVEFESCSRLASRMLIPNACYECWEETDPLDNGTVVFSMV